MKTMNDAPEHFSVELEHSEASTILRCTGELDFAASPDFKDALHDALAEKPIELTLDWSGLTFMDSTGIRLLLDTLLRCRNAGIDLSWSLSTAARRTLDLVGIHDALLRNYAEGESEDKP